MNYILSFIIDNLQVFLVSIGIIAGFYILSPLFSYAIIKIFNMKRKNEEIKENPFYRPIKIFLKLLGFYFGLMYIKPILEINDEVMIWINKIFRIIVILAFANGFAYSVTENSKIIKKYKSKKEKDIDSTTVLFIVRVIKFVIYIIAAFMIAKDLGYDLNGVITGLGIGSVVITLAAQDTIKNLFGGLIIFLDKPFKVGDYIKFENYEGTVEDITFRSTRLRTLENSIAQIPNSEISSSTVVNVSQIQKRRYTLNLGLVLDTNLEKMMSLEKQILKFLNNDEMVISGSANVTFNEVRSSDYSIFIYCYIKTADYGVFLKEKERLNYIIMNILKENNIEMAYNTQTIEIKK